jgi:hypothetical protein
LFFFILNIKKMMKKAMFLSLLVFVFSNCEKDNTSDTAAKMNFRLRFDPAQQRLNNIGQPATIPAGNAAQTPDFHKMSVHYIELAPNSLTALGSGAIVFKGAETLAGGSNAVDFEKAAVVGQNEIFGTLDLKNVPPGTYEWVRASVTFQNFGIKYNLRNVPNIGDLNNQSLDASIFVGFNTYIKNVSPREKILEVNADKKQGFWVVETNFAGNLASFNQLFSGQAPAGATTVVNPLFTTSPIPAGSCVVTGKFAQPLVVTGNETGDRTVNLSFSIQNSFEWNDTDGNGQFDFYADDPTKNEKPVDMGLRGLIPSFD